MSTATGEDAQQQQQQQQQVSPCGSRSSPECVVEASDRSGGHDVDRSASEEQQQQHSTGGDCVVNAVGDAAAGQLEDTPAAEPELRRVAPEHSCLRSSLELLIQRSASVDRPTPPVSFALPSDSCGISGCLPEEPKPSSSSFELLSPTLGTAESNSHSIISGEFNLASLSSDSGVQFGGGRGGTEELSGTTDYVLSSSVKTSDSEKSPSKKTIDDDDDDGEEELLNADEEQLLVVRVGDEESDEEEHPVPGRRKGGLAAALLLSPTSSCSSSHDGGGVGGVGPHLLRPCSSNSSASSESSKQGGAGGKVCGVAGASSPGSSTPSSSPHSGSSSDLSDRESASTAAGADADRMFGGCVGFGRSSGGGGGGGTSSGGEDGTDKGLLRRSSSVRAKASMFAQLESKLKENENPLLNRPIVARPRRAQFTTQTISPTDIERSNNAINSGLSSGQYRTPPPPTTGNSTGHHHQPSAHQPIMNTIPTNNNTNNNNIVSDDSGAEFDPSTLQVSKKVKLFSGGCVTVKGGGGEDGADQLTAVAALANGTANQLPAVRRRKTLLKVRTIGKLAMPKFLNDSNNNVSVRQQQQQQHQEQQQCNGNGSTNGTGSEGETELLLQHIVPKVDRIRRKFMSIPSTTTTTFLNSTENGVQSPTQGGHGDDASDGSDSNVDSGKENNYDSGVENMNGPSRPSLGSGSSNVLALKRNFLNSTNRSKVTTTPQHKEKDPALDVSTELDGVVTKGKVSRLANQWNRLRMTLDVSSILKAPGTTFDTPPSPTGRIGNGLAAERECESLPIGCGELERSYNLDSSLERSQSTHHNSTSQQQFSRSFTRKSNGSSRFALVEDRFAKYFGCKAGGQSSPAAAAAQPVSGKSMIVSRNSSVREPNTPTNNGTAGKQQSRRRSQSMPKESLLLEQRLETLISTIAANGWDGKCTVGGVQPVQTVEELNLTTEDLSMADTEFDKLFIGCCR